MDNREAIEKDEIIDRIHWQFATTFGEVASVLLDCKEWATYAVGPEGKFKHFLAGNANPAEQLAYELKFSKVDPLSPEFYLAKGLHIARLTNFLQTDVPAHCVYQTEFLDCYGIIDILELLIQADSGLIIGCSLLRHRGENEFTEEDCLRAQSLKKLGDLSLSATFPKRRVSLEVMMNRFPFLTPREMAIIQLISTGLNNKQLCRELGISLPTVKTHLNTIFRKMNVTSRTELASKVLG